MDLDINNYSIDELSNVFKIQLSNINNDNLKYFNWKNKYNTRKW